MAAAALLASSLAFVPLVTTPWGAVLVASVSLAGGGATFALLTADMLARVDPAHASTAGGLTASAQSLAYVIASPLVGRVVKQTHAYDSVLVVLGLIVLPGALVWALWPMGHASRSPSPSSAT
jgi:predicted MFS family arabinose efflux permease